MQIIPAAVQTLLKSLKMTGADRPAYKITIGTGAVGGGTTPVSTPAELAALDPAGSYIQTADIDLSGYANWTPLASFTGFYNGNSKKITGLTITSGADVGLFTRINGGTVVNVEISGASVTGSGTAASDGVLAGYVDTGSTITNCKTSGTITGLRDVGGLIGYDEGATITGCSSSCAVSATGTSGHAGGLIGVEAGSGAVISECHTTGAINGKALAGGLIAQNLADVTHCYATGNVASSAGIAGGLIALNQGNINKCYATGTASGVDYAGGLIGENDLGAITNCYATGAATSTSVSGAAGGLIGELYDTSGIDNCYSTGAPTSGSSDIGGLVGLNDAGAGLVTESYYDSTTSGQSDNDGRGLPRATASMVYPYNAVVTYSGWDFAAIWGHDTGGTVNDGYPYLLAPTAATIDAKSITIDRGQGQAAQATIVLDNKAGQYSPDGSGDWAGILMPNQIVTIEQGYGSNLAQTFTGYIDSVAMTNFPAEIRISCRDKGKLALDRIVTNAVDGGHYVKFVSTTVEDAVTALAGLCGLTTGTVEATGMTLTSKLFSWESYADAIDWLADISNSCWRVDEFGVIHFTRDVMPVSPTTAYSFAEGEDIISLGYMISDQDLYYTATVYGAKDYAGTVDTSSKTVTWVSGDKFNTAWAEDTIITIGGSTYRIDAVASDASLTVKTTIGTKTAANYQRTDVIKASANFGAPLTYGLFSQKVLKIDADADTVAKCQEIANRAVALMLCRCRVVDFAAIAVPWLQVGDFIQVTETTSTISELYRITNISLNQEPSGFTMGITCFWYGEVPT